MPLRASAVASAQPARPPPTIATSTSAGSGSAVAVTRAYPPEVHPPAPTVAARATRYLIGPPTIDDSTRRPAAAIRDVSSATVYARRTDSGASRRV